MKRSIIVCMDGNSVRLLILYMTEAITASTIVFSYRLMHYIHLFKYIQVLHIHGKKLPFKIAENKAPRGI